MPFGLSSYEPACDVNMPANTCNAEWHCKIVNRKNHQPPADSFRQTAFGIEL